MKSRYLDPPTPLAHVLEMRPKYCCYEIATTLGNEVICERPLLQKKKLGNPINHFKTVLWRSCWQKLSFLVSSSDRK